MERNIVAVAVAGLAFYLWKREKGKEGKQEKIEKWFENLSPGRIPDSMITIASTPGQGMSFE